MVTVVVIGRLNCFSRVILDVEGTDYSRLSEQRMGFLWRANTIALTISGAEA